MWSRLRTPYRAFKVSLWLLCAALGGCAVDGAVYPAVEEEPDASVVKERDAGSGDVSLDAPSDLDSASASSPDAADAGVVLGPLCAEAIDCPALPGCVVVSCQEGRCIGAPSDALCAPDALCSLEVGCAGWQTFPAEECSSACGPGTQPVHVACVADEVPVDGAWCPEERPSDEAACEGGDAMCGWSAWGEWSGCSASCGGGSRTRERTCEVPGHCEGEASRSEACNTQACCSGDTCGAWTLQPKCNCNTGKRCNVRDCRRCDGSTYRAVGSCQRDCPNGCT